MLISSPLFSIRLSEQSATPPLRPWAVTPPAQCLPGCAWYRAAASAAGSLWLQLVTGHRGIRMWSGQGSWECEYLLSYYTFTNWWCPLVFQDAFPRCDSILTAFALTLVFKPEIEIGSQPFCTSTIIENTLIKMQNRFISRNVSLLCLVRFPTFEHSKMCD